MNHSNHSYEDCPELQPRTGWLNPTPEQMQDARNALAGLSEPRRMNTALDYIGARVQRVASGDFDADDIRRAIAMYRVYDEEVQS